MSENSRISVLAFTYNRNFITVPICFVQTGAFLCRFSVGCQLPPICPKGSFLIGQKGSLWDTYKYFFIFFLGYSSKTALVAVLVLRIDDNIHQFLQMQKEVR